MGGPTYDIPADNPYMDMECLITLDDAVSSPTCAVERSFAPLRGAHKLLVYPILVGHNNSRLPTYFPGID